MNFNIQAETAHNNVAFTDEAFYNGDWINGVVVQLGVDGQDAATVTSLLVELEGSPNMVLCQQMDVLHLRKIGGHVGGQSIAATSNLQVWVDFGFVRLQGRRLKVTVTGTAVANATVAIDVVKDNYDPSLPTVIWSYHSNVSFTAQNVIRLYGFEAGMATDDAAVNISIGGNTYAVVQQTAFRQYAYKGLEDSPDTACGLFFSRESEPGGMPKTISVNHSITGLVFVSVSTIGSNVAKMLKNQNTYVGMA